MRYVVCFFVWAGVLVTVMGSQTTGAQPDRRDDAFSAANKAYAQGQYGQAVEAYHDVLETGYESGALFYNLGNAYARLDQWGQAIRYYEKARRLRPDDSRVQHNLEHVRRQAGVYSDDRFEWFPFGIGAVVEEWSPLAIFVTGWLLLLGGLAVIVWRVRPGTGTPFHHSLVWGPIGVGLLGISIAMGTSYVHSVTQYTVVVADEVPVRTAPDQQATVDSTLSEGALLQLKRRQGTWQEVYLSGGATGWVPAQAVGEI